MDNKSIMALPSRSFAKSQDFYLDSSTSGQGAYDSEAIGGSYSIEWWEAFEDAETKVRFRVRVTDGVYGGRGPYQEGDYPQEPRMRKIDRLRLLEKQKIVVELCPRENGWVFSVLKYELLCPQAREWVRAGQIVWNGEME